MSDYIAETFMHAGYRVQLIADQDAESPANMGDNGLFIVTTKNRYFQVLHDRSDARECMDDAELRKTHWVFPVTAYIHSGVALSLSNQGYPFNDRWDAGLIGFIFASKSEWKYRTRECKNKRASAHSAATSLIETWNQYLSGDVWGYVVAEVEPLEDIDVATERELADQDEVRHVDSCWGFYGLDYARKEAKEQAEYARKHETVESAKVEGMMHV